MNLARVLKQPQRNGMHRRIAPALVEEASRPVQMVEVVLVRLRPPEAHVSDLKVAPEVARRVTIRVLVVLGPAYAVRQEAQGVLLVGVLRVLRHELDGLGPQARDGLGSVVEGQGEAVGLVVVLHEAEDVVVDVAEEVDLGLDAPVVLGVLEGRVLVEEAGVPAAHLVVGDLLGVLDVVFLEDLDGFLEEIVVDPRGDFPVLFGNNLCIIEYTSAQSFFSTRRYVVTTGPSLTIMAFGAGLRLRLLLKLLGKGDVIEERPGIIELVVPCALEIVHRLEHARQLLVAHQRQQRRVDPVGVLDARRVAGARPS